MHNIVHGFAVIGIDHEVWGFDELLLWIGGYSNVCERAGEVIVSIFRRAQRLARIIAAAWRQRMAFWIPKQTALRVPDKAGHLGKIAAAETLPAVTVFGKHNVAGNLAHDDSNGEDVSRFVETAVQYLRGDVVTVALAVDVGRGRPNTGETEVGNLQDPLPVNEDIGWLEIQMNETLVVDVFDSLCLD